MENMNTEKSGKFQIESVSNQEEGLKYAKDILYKTVDDKTVLFLSGGKTPKNLYSMLAMEQKLNPKAVAVVDERYGEPMHGTSNELMIRETGFPAYLLRKNIPYYSVLEEGHDIKDTAVDYGKTVENLLSSSSKSIAILGMGEDGHTAGIAPNRDDFINPIFSKDQQDLLVSYFIDPKPMSPDGNPAPPYGFGQRITLTINALRKMDSLIILAFGENKKNALLKILQKNSPQEIPLSFINDGNVFNKTVLITDQKL